ncbi:MAG: SDR family oxidoreductase [Actinomycetota bacterium]|nr:SDR family oxidoreductase [Actinomycetota bacterium]
MTSEAGRVVPARRLVVIGASGLIGSHLTSEAMRQGLPVISVSRGELLEDVLTQDDIVVNCALTPAYRTGPYDPAADLERKSAEIARRCHARVLMLSTRKVYAAACQWGAREEDEIDFDGPGYGPNKARTEAWIEDALGERALILRLANAFGFEYTPGGPVRPSFFGHMLHRLRHEGEIYFDMASETRRDFIPVWIVVRSIVGAVKAGASGVFNIGSGSAVACGDVARALISGYGEGRLQETLDVRDEFFLNNSKWTTRFGRPEGTVDPLVVAHTFGERLRYA